jgi:hypothetical protein
MPLGANKVALFGSSGVVTDTSILLATGVASASASLAFTIPTTYKEIVFGFYNINPATDRTQFTFQVNSTNDAGGDYDVSLITSTYFVAYHGIDAQDTALTYHATYDQAQAAGFQTVAYQVGGGADESAAGILHLFSPASTTYVKHFYSRSQVFHGANYSQDQYAAGYINDASYAIDDIQFKMSSGNFDGTIKMWGVL